MVHRVVRFHQDHLVFRRQLQNIGRRFLSPDEQDAGNIRHLCRPDRLHVAQTRDEEHAVAIQCQDIAHQVAGEGALHFMVLYKGYICRDNVRNSYNFASEKIRKVITKS